jgi:hypothetical protein
MTPSLVTRDAEPSLQMETARIQDTLVLQNEEACTLAEATISPTHSEINQPKVNDPVLTLAPSHLFTLILSRINHLRLIHICASLPTWKKGSDGTWTPSN